MLMMLMSFATESFFGKIAASISWLHRRRIEIMSGRMEIWLILHNNLDRMSYVDAVGNEQVSEKYEETRELRNSTISFSDSKSRFQSAGGTILQKYINSLSEFDGRLYAAIFNCTGLGASKLCNDTKMVPIRGQIIKVRAPWIRTAFYADYDTYILPGFDGIVTLGGTRQYESYNLNVDKYDSLAIRERCDALLPSLKMAPVVREAVGLRPYRCAVRVEADIIKDTEGNSLICIHNYGHGAYGVTSSPGTANYAVELAKRMLGRSSSKL